jgi:hypothetical protein
MAILYTAARDSNENRYEGFVLAKVVDQSYRIMSDVWGTADFARVWDEATASPKMILVNVYDMNPESWRPVQITVDATDEVKAKYRDWQVKGEYERLLGSAEIAAKQIEKGCIAKVVKGKNGKSQEVALIDARKAIAMFEKTNVPVLGIVENMSWFLCPGDGKRYDIFGTGGGAREAARLKVPLLGEIPIEPKVREAGDTGLPAVASHTESEAAKAFLSVAGKIQSVLA